MLLHALPQAQLLAALASSDVELRRAAADAIASIDDPAALGALAGRLGEPDLETRRSIVRAIAAIDHPDVSKLLMRALKDSDPEIRETAAEARLSTGAGGLPFRAVRPPGTDSTGLGRCLCV